MLKLKKTKKDHLSLVPSRSPNLTLPNSAYCLRKIRYEIDHYEEIQLGSLWRTQTVKVRLYRILTSGFSWDCRQAYSPCRHQELTFQYGQKQNAKGNLWSFVSHTCRHMSITFMKMNGILGILEWETADGQHLNFPNGFAFEINQKHCKFREIHRDTYSY